MPEISDPTLSGAWRKALTLARSSKARQATNLIVNVTHLDEPSAPEEQIFRSLLDSALIADGKHSVATVANTIFPVNLWNPTLPRQQLYERYMRIWPWIKSNRENRRGTYFQRMIGYPQADTTAFNQLEHVIMAYGKGIHRRSTLQCGILVPEKDLNPTPYQGFPCMQQIAFMPEANKSLRVTALYPMHYLWARAYGNYLGLVNLGRFMASQMHLTLKTVTCISLVAKAEDKAPCEQFLLEGQCEDR